MGRIRTILAAATGLFLLAGGCTRKETIPLVPKDFIADPVFRDYCKETFDFNGDGYFTKDEAARLEELWLDNMEEITTLKGIEFFSALKKLGFGNNAVEKAGFGYNLLLEELNCPDNRLTELDISRNTNLRSLNCSGNPRGLRIYVWEGFDPESLDIYVVPEGTVTGIKPE